MQLSRCTRVFSYNVFSPISLYGAALDFQSLEKSSIQFPRSFCHLFAGNKISSLYFISNELVRPIVSNRLLSKLIENIHRTNDDQDREMSSYIRIPMIDQLFFSAILSTARVFQIRILVLVDFDRSRRGNREEISNRSLGCLATNLTGNRRFAAKDTPAERLNED